MNEKIVVTANGYDRVDGRNAYRSDIKRLTLGSPTLEQNQSRKNPPNESPSLAVALRIDQSASMSAFGRLEAAKEAAIAVCEFCDACGIPVLIYGDTADRSPRERMSMYAYLDWEEPASNDKYSI